MLGVKDRIKISYCKIVTKNYTNRASRSRKNHVSQTLEYYTTPYEFA